MIASSLVFYALHMRRMKGVITVDPFTKEYNKTESPIERRLFKSLWALNYPVVCQYPFGRYRLDMALPFLKLCRKAHDRKRDAYLKSRGWTTLRFSGSQINSNINWVVRRIEKEIEKRKTHLN
jgi:very-short-patch-repair endonuclease